MNLIERIDAVLHQLALYPLSDDVYGHFMGGDPRLFRPDEESCTSAELAAHKAACEAWDAGNEIDYDDQCSGWMGGDFWPVPTCSTPSVLVQEEPLIHYTRSPFGVGTQHFGIYDDLEPLLEELREALA